MALLVVLGVVAAACGDRAEDASTTQPRAIATTITASTSSSAPTTAAPPITTVAATTTVSATTTGVSTTIPRSTTTRLAGEPIDGPPEGAVLGVMGVAHDDVLNVRAGPGVAQDIIATLDPLADNVVAAGRAWLLPGSIWYEVTVEGTTGWANSRFLTAFAFTDDASSEVVSLLGARTPRAETMLDLGLMVAEAFVFETEDATPRITVTVAPAFGELGEVTYDVVGFADDSIAGFRLHIVGAPDGEGFSLVGVERTFMCHSYRGISPDGLCT